VNKLPLLLTAVFLAGAGRGAAVDLWQYPEAAEKNALFLDVRFASLSFQEGGFTAFYPEFALDWLPPLFLPFSVGAYFRTPDPNFKSFGLRAGYHINLGGDGKTDLYLLYVFELGFLRRDILEQYNDSAPPFRLYDFRAGVRRIFGRYLCLSLETDYKLWGITFGVSLKLY
jgi:hypothetical protein